MNQDFNRQMTQLAGSIQRQLNSTARNAAAELTQRVVQRTPVKSGALRGAWQAGVNSAPNGPGAPDKDGSATVRRAQAAMENMAAADSFHLVNHLPYAQSVEYGSSNQAPAGMVRITANEFDQIVDQALKRAKMEVR